MTVSLWPTMNGVQIGNGPIFTVMGADIVMTEIGQFNKSSVTLPAADRRAVAALAPFTLIEVVQDTVGTICYGYILNPRQQITDNGDHTITLELEPLTVECLWRLTRRGWIAANLLTVIANRLAALVPGWTCDPSTIGAGQGGDFQVSVTLDNPTVLGGFLDTAKQFSQFVRLGVDAAGAPTRRLEMGQFGAPAVVTIQDPKGGDADAMAGNTSIRLAATVDRQPNDVSKMINFVVPFGGGSNDAIVTLERLWRILHDSAYPDYGKQATLFPEYDPNYPIADPLTGTRGVTLNGQYDYPVYDAASYATYGHKEGQFIDSGLNYADNSAGNQELTERSLYLQCIANFKRFAHPHHTFTCTTNDANTRPTRAGDLINIDYQRVSTDDTGAIVEIDVVETLRVMSVVRHFAGEATPTDTYTLSNLGRFDEDDASGNAATARQMIALAINQGTSIAPMTINDTDNVDALNPMTTHVSIPAQKFRWWRCNLRVDFYGYRATAATMENSDATINITTRAQNIVLPATTDVGINTTATAANQPITAMPKHRHQLTISNGPRRAPTATDNWLGISGGPLGDGIIGNLSSGEYIPTTLDMIDIDLNPTSHAHTVPVAAVARPAGQTIAHIPASTAVGPLPTHVHKQDQRIPSGPPAPSCSVRINGNPLSSGLTLRSGSRNGDGSFSGSFEIDDISSLLNTLTGDVDIVLSSNTSSSNPYGVGRFKLSATWFAEYGGLTLTVRAR